MTKGRNKKNNDREKWTQVDWAVFVHKIVTLPAVIAHWGLIGALPFLNDISKIKSIRSLLIEFVPMIWVFLTAYGGYYRRNDLKWFRFPLSVLILYFLYRMYAYTFTDAHKRVAARALADKLVLGVIGLDIMSMLTLVWVSTNFGALEKPDWLDKIKGTREGEYRLNRDKRSYSCLTRFF